MAKAIPDERMRKFSGLSKEVVTLACNLIENLSKPAWRFIQDSIAIELAYINTNHPDFF